jgi:simple sugar transport system ATP-binding protein
VPASAASIRKAYHAYSTGDRFIILRRGENIAAFERSERTIGEVIELMAGGAELKSLLSRAESAAIGIDQ